MIGLSLQQQFQQFASDGFEFGLYCMCGDIHRAGQAMPLIGESAASKVPGP